MKNDKKYLFYPLTRPIELSVIISAISGDRPTNG